MKKGWHQTAESNEKRRKAMMGNTNGLGYLHTEEELQKMRKSHLGKILSEKTRMKIGAGNKGKKRTEAMKKKWREANLGEKSPRYGIHDTEETKKKKREAMMGNTNGLGHRSEEFRKKMQGKNNPNYIHGKSNEPYPLAWTDLLKESIRYRDNYTCQLCGVPERECLRKLDIHHIDYDKKNLNLKNLITLCNRCNGKVNSNREYWTKYFQRVIAPKERR